MSLEVGPGQVVAVAGAGGKTTLIYRLAAEARAAGQTVLVTTTTHMGRVPDAFGPVLVEDEGDRDAAVASALASHGGATLLGRRVRDDKLAGIAPERVDELARRGALVLVEADGARQRSLKVPAGHEPVLPRSTDLVVVVAALDLLGRPLGPERVHRLELVEAATGRVAGTLLDEDAVAEALAWLPGYPSRVPPGSRSAVFLNKVEDDAARAAAARIASRLVGTYGKVVAGSARAGPVETWP